MSEKQLQISYSLHTIKNVLPDFWQFVKQYRILAFSGEMGAGKTTFIHALCKYLNVKDAVSSPTFSLINEYYFHYNGEEKIIYHMDWYRLRDTEEAINAGMEDVLNNTTAYCFVEWAEKATDLLPPPLVWIKIEVVSEQERQITAFIKNNLA